MAKRYLTPEECEKAGLPNGAWTETKGVNLPSDDTVVPVDPPWDLPYKD